MRNVAVIGTGRMGSAISAALRLNGVTVVQVTPTEDRISGVDAVVLAVPDRHIATSASRVAEGILVGHLSGATGLDVFSGREGFSMHPLTTIAEKRPIEQPEGTQSPFSGVWAAIDGTNDSAVAFAEELASLLGMRPFHVAPGDRAAYHAAASVASNFLITIENFAEQLAHSAGVPREALVPLVEAAVENWARLGPKSALTGPVARGDAVTVAAQREIVNARTPEFLDLFDTLVTATEHLAHGKNS